MSVEIQIRRAIADAHPGLASCLEGFAGCLLEELGLSDSELSLLLTDDSEIAELNSRYRGISKPTDVLSFATNEAEPGLSRSEVLGDVVISVVTAKTQAEELGVSLEDELLRLLIHGTLHLIGYDHENVPREEAEEMEAKEQELFQLLVSEKD